VSISRTFPSAKQHNRIESVAMEYVDVNNKKKANGLTLYYRKTKTTQYNLKNNSTDKTVEKFYIDHTADASHGGYVITTKEKVVKAVTGKK
jgi:hypothetical protein